MELQQHIENKRKEAEKRLEIDKIECMKTAEVICMRMTQCLNQGRFELDGDELVVRFNVYSGVHWWEHVEVQALVKTTLRFGPYRVKTVHLADKDIPCMEATMSGLNLLLCCLPCCIATGAVVADAVAPVRKVVARLWKADY